MGMTFTIGWLYPRKMNIYGDRGNVIALRQRAAWRGLCARVVEIHIGDPIPDDIDVFFFGGGQDEQQIAVSRDLQGAKGDAITLAIEQGAGMLAGRGVDLDRAQAARRAFAAGCLDWTERRPHLAGALGAEVLRVLERDGIVQRERTSRTVHLNGTPTDWLAGS